MNRRYQLQVAKDGEFETWSNYVAFEKAHKRAQELRNKGESSRVIDQDTGEVLTSYTGNPPPEAEECIIWCGDVHVGANGDGSCML